jgi:hypothetical protein
MPRFALDLLHIKLPGVTALLTIDQRLSQGANFLLVLFQQTQACADDFAGRAVASGLDLLMDEVLEVIPRKAGGKPLETSMKSAKPRPSVALGSTRE